MSVHYSWSEAKTKKYRWYFILPPAIIAFGVALPPLFYEMYNFGGLYSCFIASYPADCEFTPEHNCERGQGENIDFSCMPLSSLDIHLNFHSYTLWQVHCSTTIFIGSMACFCLSLSLYSCAYSSTKYSAKSASMINTLLKE